ncbi:MAG: DUF2125 domain-containing protein [Pseudomonadota bacterium]
MAGIVKWLAGIGIVGLLGWVGWWFAAAAGQEAALEAWLAARAEEGWQAEGAVDVAGFPMRFERRIEEPALADPEAGWAWRAPWIDATSPVFDPTNLALRLPNEQSFAVPAARVAVASERFEGLLSVTPGLTLPLRSLGLQIDALQLTGREGWTAGAKTLRLAFDRRSEGAPENTYSFDVAADAVALPQRLLGRLGMEGLGTLQIEGQVVSDRPLDLPVLETGIVGARTLVVREGRLTLGSAALEARGRIDADAEGFAEGSLEIVARDWERLLDGLVQAGALHPRMGDGLRQALGFAALLGGGETLTITLGFSGGEALIGPIAIGEAPRMLPQQKPRS